MPDQETKEIMVLLEIREAVGDGGKMMQDELVAHIKGMANKLAEYENPKNWTRGYNYKGELVKEFALYIPKLTLKGRSKC